MRGRSILAAMLGERDYVRRLVKQLAEFIARALKLASALGLEVLSMVDVKSEALLARRETELAARLRMKTA